MGKDIIQPVNLRKLLEQGVELLLKGILLDPKRRKDNFYNCSEGRVYQVTSRMPERIEGYELFGKIEKARIWGTDFVQDPQKTLWENWNLGKITWDELVKSGGNDGFDPILEGDYIGPLSRIGVDTSDGLPGIIIGFPAMRYDLQNNACFGDKYQIQLFFERSPIGKTEKIISV